MHILLTDVLTCPRCGPEFGLIVLADRMDDRRVVEGFLGCANCREEYPVRGGVADLRFPPGAGAPPAGPAGPAGEDAALRMAALLGARERPGTVLLLGVPGETAEGVARLLPASRVVAAGGGEAGEEVTRIRVGERLPFRDRSLSAVGMAAPLAPGLLDEAVRVLFPGGRIVLDPAPDGAAEALAARGLGVLLEQDGVVVASPSAAR